MLLHKKKKKMDNNEKQLRKPHCLVLSFPMQSHINPILQFSKRLKYKGIARITFVTTKFFLKSATHFPADTFPVETFSDGFDDGGAEKVNPQDYFDTCWKTGSETLGQLIEKLRGSGSGVDCLIYDPFYQWALDVAKKYELMAAMFFTQSNCVNNVYFRAYTGELKLPVSEAELRVPAGLVPELELGDLPSFIRDYESDPVRGEMMVKQFRNVEMVDWIFVNTFYELEHEVCDWLAKTLPVKAVGPTIPSFYLDNRLPDDKEYGLSAFKPITDSCINWLHKQPTKSAIYVSFGSFAEVGVEQLQMVALALKAIDAPFLWVVRASEEDKLPKNFIEETSDRGMVVTWCNQLDVLGHEAIGCFITHCGWNSTLEAISSGVPMVVMPYWSDQSTNAKLVADVWRTGVRARKDEKGVVREEEIVRCVKHVMEGDEIGMSAMKWKKLAREAVDEGGTSDTSIQDFVSALVTL